MTDRRSRHGNFTGRRPGLVGTILAVVLAALEPAPATAQAPTAPSPPLDLPTVVERALAVDPTVAAARAGVDASDHALDVARAERLPLVSSSATATRHQDPMIVAPLHGLDLSSPPEFDRTLVQSRLGFDWTAWDGGGRGARIRRAEAGRGAAESAAGAVRQERIAATTGAYLDVLTARDVVGAQDHRIDALVAERERVARFLAEGTAPRLALLRAEAELAAVQAEATAARSELRVAESHLARLLDVSPGAVSDAALRDVRLPARSPAPASSGAPEDSTGVAGHPALSAALARADAARALVQEAEARWLPTVGADGGFMEYGGASSDFIVEWRAGVSVSWPVFTGGARRAGEDRARAGSRQAVEEVRALERDLRIAADRARAAQDEADARVAALAAAEERFEELVRVESLALREGVGLQSDYLRAEAGLFDTRSALAAARRARVMARLALGSARGELTTEWVATHTEAGEPVAPAAPAPTAPQRQEDR